MWKQAFSNMAKFDLGTVGSYVGAALAAGAAAVVGNEVVTQAAQAAAEQGIALLATGGGIKGMLLATFATGVAGFVFGARAGQDAPPK